MNKWCFKTTDENYRHRALDLEDIILMTRVVCKLIFQFWFRSISVFIDYKRSIQRLRMAKVSYSKNFETRYLKIEFHTIIFEIKLIIKLRFTDKTLNK